MKNVKTIVLIAIIIASFNSCQKTDFKETLMNEKESELLSISEAKLWIEAKYPGGLIMKSGDKDKKKYYLTKKWDKAKKFKNDKVEVVEVPLDSDEKFGFITAEAEKLARNTGVLEYVLSETRLLIQKNKKTGVITAHFMTIIGNPEYLDKTDFKVDKNTFLKKEKDFSGLVLFHNLNGIFNIGWRYTDGKLTHRITRNSLLDSGLRLKEALVEADYYQIRLYETITTWHFNGDFEIIITNVETVTISEYIECYYFGEESGITGGGGTPSSTDTATQPMQDCDCETCPICGGCVAVPTLKGALLPDDDGTTTTTNETATPCPVCSCEINFDIDGYGRLTELGKELIRNYPFEARLIFENKGKAESKTKELFGYNGLNDCSDAFRHAYFQALNAYSVGRSLAEEFAYAHESETPIKWLMEKQMDYHNNAVGINIGTNSFANSIEEKVMNALKNGELIILDNIDSNDPNFRETHGILNETRRISSANCF